MPPTDGPEGRSLSPLLRGEAGLGRAVAFGETRDSAAAIGEQYKYVYYAAGGNEQLFDTREDPDDTRDLLAIDAGRSAAGELREALINYLAHNRSELVAGQAFAAREPAVDFRTVQSQNHAASRGPMRGGMGY